MMEVHPMARVGGLPVQCAAILAGFVLRVLSKRSHLPNVCADGRLAQRLARLVYTE